MGGSQRFRRLLFVAAVVGAMAAVPSRADEFTESVKPVLSTHCQTCHQPDDPNNKVPFLQAASAEDVAAERSLWLNVAQQLRNRTMPPTGPQPKEADRFRIATWIDETLRETACQAGEFAGDVTVRRLNRHEYQNTLRDLFGLHFDIVGLLPVDNSGGEGFDNNGETLYLPPLLMERYLEVTQQILDQVIVSPPLERAFVARDLLPGRPADEHNSIAMRPGEEVSRPISVYLDGDYEVEVWIRSPAADTHPEAEVLIDGISAAKLRFSWSAAKATAQRATIRLSRGTHELALQAADEGEPMRLVTLDIRQKAENPDARKLGAHFRLFGRNPGETPIQPKLAAERLLKRFVTQAFRRPATGEELDRFLTAYERGAERGDPYEESVKLALKAVLISPDFLFRMESAPEGPGIQPISQYELAARLSYFLWGSTPDEELLLLADRELLQDDEILRGQVDRLLDHPRSRFFVRSFIGQWLGTKDVGTRVAPTLNEIQHFYTPQIAADMREEPILLFQRMLNEDRSLLEFLNADYTFLTERLANHYGMAGAVTGNEFQLVSIEDGRRGGLLGMGGVQAMNAGYKRTSPVLRGAWVLETLLGTKVPSPPPDVPPLETEENKDTGLSVREMLTKHREDPSCKACHDVIDPIGFGLENYDWLGRWRDAEDDGRPVDASGTLPSGESFDGPAELQQALLSKKAEMLRHVTGKLLGYALGRGLVDQDQCVVQRIVTKLEKSDYGARSLVREVVLSKPFRYAGSTAKAADD